MKKKRWKKKKAAEEKQTRRIEGQEEGANTCFSDCCSLTRGPPHSTTLLPLADVQRIAQNLGGSCQNLERTLPSSARILATKCKCVRAFQCRDILKNHPKMVSKPSKSIKIAKNAVRTKKIAPRNRKGAKMVPLSQTFGTPQGIKNQPKSKKRGFENRCFFRFTLGTDFASF